MTCWGGPMHLSYRVLLHDCEYRALYDALRRDNTLWALWPDVDADEWTPDALGAMLSRDDVLTVRGEIDGAPAGVMTMHPVMRRTLTAEIGVAAFRPYFPYAAALCRGALLWACGRIKPASFLGKVAAPNRHALRLLGQVGFSELGRVPGLCWYTRKQRFVDGVLVMATPESIKNAANAANAGGV